MSDDEIWNFETEVDKACMFMHRASGDVNAVGHVYQSVCFHSII